MDGSEYVKDLYGGEQYVGGENSIPNPSTQSIAYFGFGTLA